MSELQPAIDRARDEAIVDLFSDLVLALERRATDTAAADRFNDGLDAILQAHKIASGAARAAENT